MEVFVFNYLYGDEYAHAEKEDIKTEDDLFKNRWGEYKSYKD
jgi:hypothetical protein